MARYNRNFTPGGTFYVTLSLADRQSSALVDHIAALRTAMHRAREKAHFGIKALVVLPNHLHAVVTLPQGDDDFTGRWRLINSGFASAIAAVDSSINCDADDEYALWQKRYWEHAISDDTDLARHIEYIHFNPVKHGLVERVSEWPHSSFHRYVRRGLLPDDWASTAVLPGEDFGEFEA
jgi:putative transposase